MAKKVAKDWACQECGRRMSLKAAQRAMSVGCAGCGGSDVDLAPAPRPRLSEALAAAAQGLNNRSED
jgi:PHP family Zn ribbon phosphoesterase